MTWGYSAGTINNTKHKYKVILAYIAPKIRYEGKIANGLSMLWMIVRQLGTGTLAVIVGLSASTRSCGPITKGQYLGIDLTLYG